MFRRIIPARAGFTLSRRYFQGRAAGSSPLARGLLSLTLPVVGGVRIIPARAGFTVAGPRRHLALADHPRSRGVYEEERNTAMSTIGSSPLARGLRAVGLVLGLLGGIIPARAGFTLCSSGTRSCSADHPRSRGVYVRHSRCDRGQLGSSPLARGLPCSMRSVIGAFRIIPARAGFTCPTGQQPAPCPDHPRSRGVYAGNAVSEGGQVGSSPLARGLPAAAGAVHGARGIIPARAGFTPAPSSTT